MKRNRRKSVKAKWLGPAQRLFLLTSCLSTLHSQSQDADNPQTAPPPRGGYRHPGFSPDQHALLHLSVGQVVENFFSLKGLIPDQKSETGNLKPEILASDFRPLTSVTPIPSLRGSPAPPSPTPSLSPPAATLLQSSMHQFTQGYSFFKQLVIPDANAAPTPGISPSPGATPAPPLPAPECPSCKRFTAFEGPTGTWFDACYEEYYGPNEYSPPKFTPAQLATAYPMAAVMVTAVGPWVLAIDIYGTGFPGEEAVCNGEDESLTLSACWCVIYPCWVQFPETLYYTGPPPGTTLGQILQNCGSGSV